MKNRKKLRRVAMLALVLVLLCNTLGVNASTGAQAITVSSYGELVTAIGEASNLDTILIGGVIQIPEGASVGGAELFSAGSYDLGTIEDMADLYHEEGLEPLSWESDYTDPDYGATCLKLSYEEYVPPVDPPTPTEPEPTPDPTDPPSPTDPTPTEPVDPEPTDPTPTDPPQPTDPEPTPTPTDPPTTEEPSTEDPKPSTPSDAEQGGNNTTDNSSSSSSSVSNVDNSSHLSNTSTDNSKSESNKTENSHNSTTNNTTTTNNSYYTQEQAKQEGATASQSASQPVNISVPVNLSIPEQKGQNGANTEAPASTSTGSLADKNISIDAKGVDVKLEIIGDSYNISISAPEQAKEEIQTIATDPTPTASQEPTEANNKPNWVECMCMILLAVLVLLEAKDRLQKKPE